MSQVERKNGAVCGYRSRTGGISFAATTAPTEAGQLRRESHPTLQPPRAHSTPNLHGSGITPFANRLAPKLADVQDRILPPAAPSFNRLEWKGAGELRPPLCRALSLFALCVLGPRPFRPRASIAAPLPLRASRVDSGRLVVLLVTLGHGKEKVASKRKEIDGLEQI